MESTRRPCNEDPANNDSDRLTVVNSTIFGNGSYAIHVPSVPPTAPIMHEATIVGNTIFDNADTGIYVEAPNSMISDNEAFGNSTGIHVSGTGTTVSGNLVHDNTSGGISASPPALVSGPQILVMGNTVYGHPGEGISISRGTAINNVVYGNSNGLVVGGVGSAIDNRVYHNSNGILVESGSSTVRGNTVYSNKVGVRQTHYYGSTIENNVIYANTELGILVHPGDQSDDLTIASNTIFQTVGDAVRIEGNSQYVQLRNNILWVEKGYDISVANDSQVGFQSDYNLLYTTGSGKLGLWEGQDFTTQVDWFYELGFDGHSQTTDPLFVDFDGADNVLGFVADEGGFDGGPDDNFLLKALSPAIDRGDSWASTPQDILGTNRVDDPGTPNTGSPDYFESQSTQTVYEPAAVGVAQNWRADDQAWTLNLPFAFSFYGTAYTSVQISSNGLLQFAGPGNAASPANGAAALGQNVCIAPLWADLRTDGLGSDIFLDMSIDNQISIRWAATNKADGSPVNFSVTLFSVGLIHFDYGAGNAGLNPTVGVSSGDGQAYQLISGYDGQAFLSNEDSVQLIPSSYEYSVVAAGPSAILAGGVAQGWHGVDAAWPLTLPFEFPFYNARYTSVLVSSKGFLQFEGPGDASDWSNSTSELLENACIAPFWADLRTDLAGNDIFVDESVAGQITIRWAATNFDGDQPVNVAVTLFNTGKIRFDYGAGNSGEAPTIGISSGDGHNYALLPYDGQSNLANANAYVFDVQAAPFFDENVVPNAYYGEVGAAKNWRGDNTSWNLNLPFEFPFYDGSYTNVRVSSEGFLQFGDDYNAGDSDNSVAKLLANCRIAPLWDNLRTDGFGNDIFVNDSIPDQVTIRWNAKNVAGGGKVDVAVTLHSDGSIRFDYGPGDNMSLTPTVGLSNGDGAHIFCPTTTVESTCLMPTRWSLHLLPGLSTSEPTSSVG